MEYKTAFFEQLFQHLPVKIVDIKDAQLTPVILHIVDNLIGAGLSQGEFIFVRALPGYQVGERIDGKGIVLGGYGADTLHRFFVCVMLFQQLGLLQHLPGIGQEFHSLGGQGNTLGAPVEDGYAHFLFQLLDRVGKAGLGYEKLLGRVGNRAAVYDGYNIAQLL